MDTLERQPTALADSPATLILVLVTTGTAPFRARHQVTVELERWGLSALCDTVGLLTSELVTNAYRAITERWPEHPPSIRLKLFPTHAGVRLEVADPVEMVPMEAQRPDDESESGRGLFLVDLLSASSWGVYPARGGKVVWAEIGGSEPDL